MLTIDECEVCGSEDLEPVIDLGNHPLCDDLVPLDSDRVCIEYPIEILFCKNCYTAHQKYQVPKRELFSEDYHYRARMTGSVLNGMRELVDSCDLNLEGIAGKTVLDIGCNDGSLLNFFREKGCKTIGIEPTGAYRDSSHETINAFFDEESAQQVLESVGQPDIITFTNVFAHIEDLRGLIRNLKTIMAPSTVLIIENHYLGSIIEYGQFDTFYHEHPRTYSFRSFIKIAKALERQVMDVKFVSRYGGNIRVYIGGGEATRLTVNEDSLGISLSRMQEEMKTWVAETMGLIQRLNEQFGPLRAKAFPGRAAILIKLLNLTTQHISAVYEIKGSIKTEHYVPGTRIPILPEAQLYSQSDLSIPILNLAWHLPYEVQANLKKNGYEGEVHHIKHFVRG
jgi:SAM-dependent methyltransferase